MAQFCAAIVKTGEQPAINDNTASHAGPQRHGHRVGSTPGRAGQHLPQRRGIGVVGDIYFLMQPFLQIFSHGDIFKQQVIGVLHHPGFFIGRSGYADAYLPDLLPRHPSVCRCRLSAFGHGIHHLFCRARNAGFGLCPADDTKRIIHNARFDVGASQIDSHIISHINLLLLTD